MLTMDKDGVVRDARIKVRLIPQIAHGPLTHIDAIVVHQTDSATAKGTMEGYRTGAKGTGAHFLIDKDGTIYQVVPLKKKCWHVAPIKSRCLMEHTCSPAEQQFYYELGNKLHGHVHEYNLAVDRHERTKKYPDRYPGNDDAIGIEITGRALNRFKDDPAYEPLTEQEQRSLHWLVQELLNTLNLVRSDVYRHPQLSFKREGEAADAKW